MLSCTNVACSCNVIATGSRRLNDTVGFSRSEASVIITRRNAARPTPEWKRAHVAYLAWEKRALTQSSCAKFTERCPLTNLKTRLHTETFTDFVLFAAPRSKSHLHRVSFVNSVRVIYVQFALRF